MRRVDYAVHVYGETARKFPVTFAISARGGHVCESRPQRKSFWLSSSWGVVHCSTLETKLVDNKRRQKRHIVQGKEDVNPSRSKGLNGKAVYFPEPHDSSNYSFFRVFWRRIWLIMMAILSRAGCAPGNDNVDECLRRSIRGNNVSLLWISHIRVDTIIREWSG